jgi:two-component SAPR family response regulator
MGWNLPPDLKRKTKATVFTSAYQQYTLDAFDLMANHFLLKPIKLSKFTKAVVDIIDTNFSRKEKTAKTSFFSKPVKKGSLPG